MDNKKMLYKIANELDKLGYSENADNIRNEICVLNEVGVKLTRPDNSESHIWIDVSRVNRKMPHSNSPRLKISTSEYGELPILIPTSKNEYARIPKSALKNHSKLTERDNRFKFEFNFIEKYNDILLSLYYANDDGKHEISINKLVVELFSDVNKTGDIDKSINNILHKYPSYNKNDIINPRFKDLRNNFK